jgi:hypothetical protein
VKVIVAVDVIDTVIVAVHVHGNDTMIVIRPVDGSRETHERVVSMLAKTIQP